MKAMRGSGVGTRFAPSPTGRLHLGHAFSATCAHDAARAGGGRFLLRIEDIDVMRILPEHVETILADHPWPGLGWDCDVLFQSHRSSSYASAFSRAKDRRLFSPYSIDSAMTREQMLHQREIQGC